MSRGTYEPTITTPLLDSAQRTPVTPTAITNGNGFAINELSNSSSRPNSEPNLTPRPTPTVDKIAIHGKEYEGSTIIDGKQYRKWRVAVIVDGQPEREPVELIDPFTAEEYDKNDNHKIRRGKLQLLNKDVSNFYFLRKLEMDGCPEEELPSPAELQRCLDVAQLKTLAHI